MAYKRPETLLALLFTSMTHPSFPTIRLCFINTANNRKNKTENITKEQLIEFGMKETEGDSAIIFPMAKVISIPQDDQADDELSICVTQLRNQTEICLKLPDGSTLYLCPENIEELKTFEKCIESYEPIY